MTDENTDSEQWNRDDDYTQRERERERGSDPEDKAEAKADPDRYTPPPPTGKEATIEILTTVAGIACLLVIATYGALKMAYGWPIPSDIVTILLLFAAGLLGVDTIMNDGGPRTDGGQLIEPSGARTRTQTVRDSSDDPPEDDQ